MKLQGWCLCLQGTLFLPFFSVQLDAHPPRATPPLLHSLYLSGIHGLLTSVTILTVYLCTFPFSLSLCYLLFLSLSLSLCLPLFHLSLSLSLFLYHRLCKVQLWVGESDLQTRWQEDAFSEYALLGSLCVTLFLLSLSYNVMWLVLDSAKPSDWPIISDIVSWILKTTSLNSYRSYPIMH